MTNTNIEKLTLKERLRKKYNMEDRNAFVFCYLILLLPIASFCVFWLYVNIDSIVQAFSKPGVGFTLSNFADVFSEMTHGTRSAMKDNTSLLAVEWRSIQLYLIGWIFMFPGYLSCYVLFKKCWGHYVFRTIFMIPTVLGGLTTVLLYKKMCMPYATDDGTISYGPILALVNSCFDLEAGVLRSGLLWHDSTAWLTLLGLKFIPHIIGFNIVQTGAYARIPGELYEVGRIDGLGFVREFWTIATPLTWSTMSIGLITGAAGMLMGDCGVFLYTEGLNKTATMGFYVYYETLLLARAGGTDLSLYGYPAALGLTITAVSIPLSLGVRKLAGLIEEVSY